MGGTDDERARAAQQGDASAAASVIAEHLPYWTSTARHILSSGRRGSAKYVEDPSDLVQEAVLRLLELWRRGEGPSTNTRSYVSTMMRNAFLDRVRSPRARERSLERITADAAALTVDDVQLADLSAEADAVRRAFARLTPDHRAVLFATVAEARKPAELVEEFDRPAPAISNLVARAKLALRRELLLDYLARDNEQCAENARRLPSRVHDRIAEHGEDERGLDHVRSCDNCRRNWQRFAAVSTAFVAVTLLTIVQLTGSTTPALAADGETEPHPEGRRTPTNGRGTPESHGTEHGRGRTLSSSASAHSLATMLASPAALVVGVVLCVMAAGAFTLHLTLERWSTEEHVVYNGETLQLGKAEAELEVRTHTVDNRRLQSVSADLAVRRTDDVRVQEVRLRLSPGVEFRSASTGLRCAALNGDVDCRPTDSTPGKTFVFETEADAPGGSFEIELIAEIDGERVIGSASGNW